MVPAMEFETQVGVLNMEADPAEPTPVFDELMAKWAAQLSVD